MQSKYQLEIKIGDYVYKNKSELVQIRVTEKMKNDMNKVNINWSEYIRDAIELRIELENNFGDKRNG